MAKALLSASDLLELLQAQVTFALLYCGQKTDGQPLEAVVFEANCDFGWEKFMNCLVDLVLPNEDTLVICYQSSGLDTAAQAWWGLKYMGRKKVAVLEGGSETVRSLGFSLPKSKSGIQQTTIQAHLVKTQAEVRELQTLPGWECQLVTTDHLLGFGLFFNPQLAFTSIGRMEEPLFLREILYTAGINLSESCQNILFGPRACTLLLALSTLGKCNLCLGLQTLAFSPRGEIELANSTEFYTAVGEDEFFDALGESRRQSCVLGAAPVLSQPHTVLKKMQPNVLSGRILIDSKSNKNCQCHLM